VALNNGLLINLLFSAPLDAYLAGPSAVRSSAGRAAERRPSLMLRAAGVAVPRSR
jgi:hypothetical protein